MRLIARFTPLLCLLLLSCIEGREEVWLNRDGSGRLEASYRMPGVVMQQLGKPEDVVRTLQEAAARDEHVELTEVTHRKEKGFIILEFSGTFDDLRKLATFPQRQLRDPSRPDTPVKEEALFGETILDLSLRKIEYNRTIDISGVIPSYVSPKRLGDSAFHYTLHLPVPASETNAPVQSEDQQTLQWTFLLRDHVSTPMHLSAQGPFPLPGPLLILALLFFVVLIAYFIFRSRRSLQDLEKAFPGPREGTP